MSKTRGYLLPEGEAYTDELGCMLVFYPDRDEYRRALIGSMHHLGTWLAWERDELKRGQDAARAWKDAIDITEECLAMNYCEEILTRLDQLIALQGACCIDGASQITYQNNTVVTTVIVPNSGPDPTLWGQTSVADWDEWLEYVCGQAHAYVDELIETVGQIKLVATIGGYTLDFVAHLFSIVQWRMVEDIIPVNFSVIQAIFNAIGEGLLSVDWDQQAADIEANRQNIICALIQGTDLETAVAGAITQPALWTAFFDHLDYESTTAAIYEGQVPGVGYLPVLWRNDCLCSLHIGEYQTCVHSYSNDPCDWMDHNGIDGIMEAYGNPVWGARTRYDIGRMRASTPQLRAEVGLTSGDPAQTVTIKRVLFDYKTDNINHGGLEFVVDPGGQAVRFTWPNEGVHVWTSVEFTLPTPITVPYNAWAIDFSSNGGNGGYLYLDNVLADFDAPV